MPADGAGRRSSSLRYAAVRRRPAHDPERPRRCRRTRCEQIPAQQGTDFAYISPSWPTTSGYVFYVEPAAQPGVNIAYWGPEIRIGPPQPPLRVNMDPASNVDALTLQLRRHPQDAVRGLDQQPRDTRLDPDPAARRHPLIPPLGPRCRSPLAFSQLGRPDDVRPRQHDASAKLDIRRGDRPRPGARRAVGQRRHAPPASLDVARYGRLLQPRRLVDVRGAGRAFDGQYFVTQRHHDAQAGRRSSRASP